MAIQNRWLLATAGVLMQITFGAVYAWSVFRIPLSQAHGWTIAEVTAAFEIAIFIVGFAAFAGGLWMKRSGPRPFALASAHFLWSRHDVDGYGAQFGRVIPDKRGMITGLAVAGFGAGALVTAPVANSLIASVGVGPTFEVGAMRWLALATLVSAVVPLLLRPPRERQTDNAQVAEGGVRSRVSS